MTYAELLADNQRLRKRIIELEQENARLKEADPKGLVSFLYRVS